MILPQSKLGWVEKKFCYLIIKNITILKFLIWTIQNISDSKMV